jgi:hypothetical protein
MVIKRYYSLCGDVTVSFWIPSQTILVEMSSEFLCPDYFHWTLFKHLFRLCCTFVEHITCNCYVSFMSRTLKELLKTLVISITSALFWSEHLEWLYLPLGYRHCCVVKCVHAKQGTDTEERFWLEQGSVSNMQMMWHVRDVQWNVFQNEQKIWQM